MRKTLLDPVFLLFFCNNTRLFYSRMLDTYHHPIILTMLIDEVTEMFEILLIVFCVLIFAGVVVGESVTTLG